MANKLRTALEKILEEPKNTLSDGKALAAIVRIAKKALAAPQSSSKGGEAVATALRAILAAHFDADSETSVSADLYRRGYEALAAKDCAAGQEQAVAAALTERALKIAMNALENIGDFMCDSTEDDAWLLKGDALDALEKIKDLPLAAPGAAIAVRGQDAGASGRGA